MSVIYLVGDSTVDDNQAPFHGWGWALPAFCASGVTVRNHGLSGRSSKSFLDEGLFAPVRDAMQAGDVLLIQFGHNDEKKDVERHTDPDTSFPEMLSIYLDAALEKGALPVLITPVSRRLYTEDGALMDTHGAYPDAIRRLAPLRGVPLIDLHRLSRALFEQLGQEDTAALFVRLAPGEHKDFPDGHDDRTHFNAEGARQIAQLVANAMRLNPQLAAYVR